jgi:hypothetical protein
MAPSYLCSLDTINLYQSLLGQCISLALKNYLVEKTTPKVAAVK